MKPNINLHILLRHFRIKAVRALQWVGSELPHVTSKLEELLYEYLAIALSELLRLIKYQ